MFVYYCGPVLVCYSASFLMYYSTRDSSRVLLWYYTASLLSQSCHYLSVITCKYGTQFARCRLPEAAHYWNVGVSFHINCRLSGNLPLNSSTEKRFGRDTNLHNGDLSTCQGFVTKGFWCMVLIKKILKYRIHHFWTKSYPLQAEMTTLCPHFPNILLHCRLHWLNVKLGELYHLQEYQSTLEIVVTLKENCLSFSAFISCSAFNNQMTVKKHYWSHCFATWYHLSDDLRLQVIKRWTHKLQIKNINSLWYKYFLN